jgi:hypothetical protein
LNFWDCSQESEDVLVKNIISLQKMGVRFVYTNVSVHNIDLVMKIKPYFVFYRDFTSNTPKEQQYAKLMRQMLTKAKVKYYVA